MIIRRFWGLSGSITAMSSAFTISIRFLAIRIVQHDFPIGPSYRADFLVRLNILSGGRPSFPGEAVASAPH